MTMKIATAIAVAAGILVMSNSAQAGGEMAAMNGLSAASEGTFQTIGHKRHGKHRRFKRHFHFGDYYQGHRPHRVCRYLKRKAYRSGSRYWWKKYRRCVNRYYY